MIVHDSTFTAKWNSELTVAGPCINIARAIVPLDDANRTTGVVSMRDRVSARATLKRISPSHDRGIFLGDDLLL